MINYLVNKKLFITAKLDLLGRKRKVVEARKNYSIDQQHSRMNIEINI